MRIGPWRNDEPYPLGYLLYLLVLLERVLGAILTAIAIVGFTGFLRGEENKP